MIGARSSSVIILKQPAGHGKQKWKIGRRKDDDWHYEAATRA
jgi:hypothetical protein